MASCGHKKIVRKVLFSTLFNPKETEYVAEDFNAELAHQLLDVM